MNSKEKIKIEYFSIAVTIGFSLYLFFGGTNFLGELFSLPIVDEIDFSVDSNFQKFGLTTIFFYEFIPEGFKFVGVDGIYSALINQGTNHFLLLIVPSVGKIFGQLLVFTAGIIIFTKFKSKSNLIKQAGKTFHKHRHSAFFLVPFGGMLGTFIMIVSGHEKINFLKVLPILFVGNLINVALYIYPMITQMNLSSLLT